jgi:uncharacterized membrane protein YdbT with pleckstrin-like domain
MMRKLLFRIYLQLHVALALICMARVIDYVATGNGSDTWRWYAFVIILIIVKLSILKTVYDNRNTTESNRDPEPN